MPVLNNEVRISTTQLENPDGTIRPDPYADHTLFGGQYYNWKNEDRLSDVAITKLMEDGGPDIYMRGGIRIVLPNNYIAGTPFNVVLNLGTPGGSSEWYGSDGGAFAINGTMYRIPKDGSDDVQMLTVVQPTGSQSIFTLAATDYAFTPAEGVEDCEPGDLVVFWFDVFLGHYDGDETGSLRLHSIRLTF